MTKKSGYKYQIEQELITHNWEVVEIDSSSAWWDDEHWKVVFLYNPSIQFYLSFIVDPQFEGPRKKGQGIYEIVASKEIPENWNDYDRITSIGMTRQKFNEKLKRFITDLEEYKKV